MTILGLVSGIKRAKKIKSSVNYLLKTVDGRAEIINITSDNVPWCVKIKGGNSLILGDEEYNQIYQPGLNSNFRIGERFPRPKIKKIFWEWGDIRLDLSEEVQYYLFLANK